MTSRIGVDIGGTFTDFIYVNEATQETRAAKLLSSPQAPELTVLELVDRTLTPEELAGAGHFLHGTTVGLNALLTRTGAKVAVLTTAGFRDVLERRRGDYGELYNPCWSPSEPLVPRHLRFPVRERIGADGSVVTGLEAADVLSAVARCEEEGVDALVVSLINAYASPVHELAVAELIAGTGFGGDVVLSHLVSGEYREYERTATAVVDAYLRGRVVGYLGRLEEQLRARGFDGELLLTRSGGGAMTFDQARRRPFETIMSGPVAGVNGAARIAKTYDAEQLITADVGGTSFDTALITNGKPNLLFQGEVVDLPLLTPWIDVRSIGAGGGSIYWVDEGGLLRVGPQSAGADPGPACYGRGGTHPTVTDAAVVLGLFGDGALAGRMTLDREAAEAAFAPLAEQLGISIEAVARGGLVIATTMMAGAIRAITVESGIDPRECTLMTFGGGGGLFATLLATELRLGRIIVPEYPGNFSAWGLLQSDVVQSAARTRLLRLDSDGVEAAGEILTDLFASLAAEANTSTEAIEREPAIDLRYHGQEHTLTVPVAWSGEQVEQSVTEIAEQFNAGYQRTFGHRMDEPLEMVTIRASTRQRLTPTESFAGATGEVAERGSHTAYSYTRQEWIDFAVVDRASMRAGEQLDGPLIVVEPTSTTPIDAGFRVRMDAGGALIVERKDA